LAPKMCFIPLRICTEGQAALFGYSVSKTPPIPPYFDNFYRQFCLKSP
jgi:hypothetical protein